MSGPRFSLLGSLEVTIPAGPLPIMAKRLRALLAILLLHSGQVVSIDRIIDGIWPGGPPRSVVENIRTYVWQLRSLLFEPAQRGRLESHPGGYRLRVHAEELDLLQFSSLASGGRRALQVGDYATASVLLGEAIALWRGTPLPELELGLTIRAKLVALEEQRWHVQTDWIKARLALGEHDQLVPTLRELLGERPLDEGLWCALMTALHSMGRSGQALAAFHEARQVLVQELGVEPGPELRSVHDAILRGDEVVGFHRFSSSTLLPGCGTPCQLPESGTKLVGREEEVRRVCGLVWQGDSGWTRRKVVLLSGLPGAGKTATAVAAATAVRGAFPDGQLYLDLRGSSGAPLDMAESVATLLRGFGINPEAMGADVERGRLLCLSLLARRRMLLVLDDAPDVDHVGPLVPGLGRSLIIVTSRRWLASIDPDLHLRVEPLTIGQALTMLGTIIGPERVDREAAAALAIVESCGRLPWPIRIVGRRLATRPAHPLYILARRLAVREQLLDELSMDGHSMRGLLETSYRALGSGMRECFQMLGLCDPTTISATRLGELLRRPVHLADRELESLVHEGLLCPGTTCHGVPMYWMPSVLHAYALERLAADGPRRQARPDP
ncbi:MAG TPA: BTAD domain-containing putative transcriptional regulator [Candidatus Dormibacteraeota bacterium]|nr:BTAD domain-containing putative transcriptional regulator [Candidatus Dormibacteraeota bacterium]